MKTTNCVCIYSRVQSEGHPKVCEPADPYAAAATVFLVVGYRANFRGTAKWGFVKFLGVLG